MDEETDLSEFQPKDDLEDFFESDSQRELRQIWQAQSSMTEALRDLSRKMDEVIGRQERTLGLLSVGGGAPPQPGQPPQPQIGGGVQVDTIRRHEVDALLNNNNYLVQVTKVGKMKWTLRII